jgi:hypothetical protein
MRKFLHREKGEKAFTPYTLCFKDNMGRNEHTSIRLLQAGIDKDISVSRKDIDPMEKYAWKIVADMGIRSISSILP